MNVEIGTEAAQFPEKEYINGIFIAVHGLFLQRFGTSLFNFNWKISNPSPWPPNILITRNLCKMGGGGDFLIIFVARACFGLSFAILRNLHEYKRCLESNLTRETNSAMTNRSRYNGWQKTFLSHRAHQVFTINVSYQILKIPWQARLSQEHSSLCFYSKSIVLGPPGRAQVFPYLSPGPLDLLVVCKNE
jgi:hypothetical protein